MHFRGQCVLGAEIQLCLGEETWREIKKIEKEIQADRGENCRRIRGRRDKHRHGGEKM